MKDSFDSFLSTLLQYLIWLRDGSKALDREDRAAINLAIGLIEKHLELRRT